jgi:predicted Zn-ribbon and HTH transcriptional regulator
MGIDTLEKQTIELEGYKSKCEKCGFEWVYTHGIPKYWIPCPKCKSKKNSLNREVFGYWHPDGEKK